MYVTFKMNSGFSAKFNLLIFFNLKEMAATDKKRLQIYPFSPICGMRKKDRLYGARYTDKEAEHFWLSQFQKKLHMFANFVTCEKNGYREQGTRKWNIFWLSQF